MSCFDKYVPIIFLISFNIAFKTKDFIFLFPWTVLGRWHDVAAEKTRRDVSITRVTFVPVRGHMDTGLSDNHETCDLHQHRERERFISVLRPENFQGFLIFCKCNKSSQQATEID